jgi:hypothetical protein
MLTSAFRQPIMMMCVLITIGEYPAESFSTIQIESRHHSRIVTSSKHSLSPLFGVQPLQSSSQGGGSGVTSGWGQRGPSSKTARESAVNVEWEPMTELERRIEDGVNYDHFDFANAKRYLQNTSKRDGRAESDATTLIGVFCGYRYTDDEYDRLKSAHP